MVIYEYPEEIKKLLKICEPYESKVKNGELKNAPPEVVDAFEKTKKWFWEQGQQQKNLLKWLKWR